MKTGIPKDPARIDSIHRQLQKYTSAVEENKIAFKDLVSYRWSQAYTPYCERFHTLALFDAFAREGTAIPPGLWLEYARITRKFEMFEWASGPAYRKALLQDLVNFIHIYQAAICFACLGEPSNPAVKQSAERETIGILLNELKKDNDLSDLELLITSLDNCLTGITEDLQEIPPDTGEIPIHLDAYPARKCDRGIP
ncbi:hypothetical protein [uncultured Methanoregula sp.]|uniref:hypothetical protein n=1 Tax=uncultured Methanoregula sp. TaxID=1005933 RepID=UPI002AAB07C3|nr:hypothetical protein [uncultured Methanoregula sp.]